MQRQDPSQATSARPQWTIFGTLASPLRILAAVAGVAADILAGLKVAGGEVRRVAAAAQSNGGWRCGQPPLSLIGCHARRHGFFSGRRRLERGLAARFRSLSGHPFEALRPKRVPGGSSFEAGLVGIPFRGPYARRLRCRRTSIGKWVRHRLAPVPRASSCGRPAIRFAGFHPCGCPPPAAVAMPWSFSVLPDLRPSGGAAPGHIQKLRPSPESRKRTRPVDN